MDRQAQIDRITATDEPWDIVVIGGGATGAGIAVDAASRGYSVALFEQSDFGKGTSSRSTKLIHGGVRYLQQGNLSLVMEALRERGMLRHNAPHLVHDMAFVVPNYDWWEAPFYGIGMKVYDMLAGKYGFGKSKLLGRRELMGRIPTLETKGLRGGVLYYDGQFDDARLLINLVQTAAAHGACMLNYCRITAIRHDDEGFARGVEAVDVETGRDITVHAHSIINATGPFCDAVRRMDEPDAPAMIAPSQGVHLVLDASFLPGDTAIMVPRTSDKRVMFAIPWHGRAVVGTTDTSIHESTLEPRPLEGEVDFILETAAPYLNKDPGYGDILSVFTGIRPLVKAGEGMSTSALSRDHTIHVARSGMITIAGGKWTTYRKMAEDCVDHAATLASLTDRPCITRTLKIHGYHPDPQRFADLDFYGADAAAIGQLMQAQGALQQQLHPALPLRAAQVVWAARSEMARTVEDVLCRRSRALSLDAHAAVEAAPEVARLMADELGRDERWQQEQVTQFEQVAQAHMAR